MSTIVEGASGRESATRPALKPSARARLPIWVDGRRPLQNEDVRTEDAVKAGISWRGCTALLLVSIMTLVGGGAGSALATRQATAEAAALLRTTATRMADLSSFHFEISTPRGETVVLDSFEVVSLEGDVQRPDRFRARLEAKAAVLDVSVDVVGIGSRLWVSDPTSFDGSYLEFDMGAGDAAPGEVPADLLNPDRLLLQAVDLIEDPVLNGRDEIDGVEVSRVDGRFDPHRVTDGDEPPPGLVGEPLPVAIWIDDEGRVRRLEIAGPMLELESGDLVRRLDLSAFDEPVEIQAPTT